MKIKKYLKPPPREHLNKSFKSPVSFGVPPAFSHVFVGCVKNCWFQQGLLKNHGDLSTIVSIEVTPGTK